MIGQFSALMRKRGRLMPSERLGRRRKAMQLRLLLAQKTRCSQPVPSAKPWQPAIWVLH